MKVVIRNEEGSYLSLVRGQAAFVERKQRAIVYDLAADAVEEQLVIVKQTFGVDWTWEELEDVRAVDGLPKNNLKGGQA